MVARWSIHGRAVVAACLLLLLLVPSGASAAKPAHLARDDHKRRALGLADGAKAREHAARVREMQATLNATRSEVPAPAPKARSQRTPKAKGGGAPALKRDYGESKPLDLPAEVPLGTQQTAGGSRGSLGRTVFGLLLVVGLIYGLTWVLRRMRNGGSLPGAGGGQGLKAVASIPLGTNRSIHLIRAGQEYLLVGAAEHGVVPLRTYSEQEARDAGLLQDAGAPPSARVPAAQLLADLRARTVRR